ncbi:MAG: substrate-binding domain-containing protein [Candidatus Nomurabacteria bacterium]|jgi:phosphate transport system substrate-binding protein|nr:substrate-binding domain-containing protein [Candidatus Nomurabacteria bacterium]
MDNQENNKVTEVNEVIQADELEQAPPMETAPKKSKGKTVALIIAIVVIITTLCVLAFSYFTKSWWFAEQQQPTQSVKTDDTPLFTLENYPKVDASTATQPLAMAFMKNFTATADIDTSKLNFTKTDQAYSKLIKGDVDLILVTSPSEDELARAKKAGVELEVTPVVNEGFVFFVSQQNPVDSLTVQQVQDIYQGKITNWNQVGGENQEIKAYQRPVNSGSQTGMLDLVMKNKQLMKAPTDMIAESMTQIINIVSGYNGGADGIGYSYYYYATTMYQDIDASVANNVKLLKIDGVAPEVESIKAGNYPFRTAYYIVINKAAAADGPARQLAEAMLSDRGQKVALEAQYVPVK